VIEKIYEKFTTRYEELNLAPGFSSHSLERYKNIITVAAEKKYKLQAISD
jgi:hypothetical protein